MPYIYMSKSFDACYFRDSAMQEDEYEDIDLDSSGVPRIPGMGVGAVSPSRRPRMPIPVALQDKRKICTITHAYF